MRQQVVIFRRAGRLRQRLGLFPVAAPEGPVQRGARAGRGSRRRPRSPGQARRQPPRFAPGWHKNRRARRRPLAFVAGSASGDFQDRRVSLPRLVIFAGLEQDPGVVEVIATGLDRREARPGPPGRSVGRVGGRPIGSRSSRASGPRFRRGWTPAPSSSAVGGRSRLAGGCGPLSGLRVDTVQSNGGVRREARAGGRRDRPGSGLIQPSSTLDRNFIGHPARRPAPCLSATSEEVSPIVRGPRSGSNQGENPMIAAILMAGLAMGDPDAGAGPSGMDRPPGRVGRRPPRTPWRPSDWPGTGTSRRSNSTSISPRTARWW